MNQDISKINASELLPKIIEIAKQASEEILKIYETDFSVEKKDDRSPLTEADMAAHHIICDGLSALTPSIPILSEESSDISYETRRQWSQYWLVDPLDGTREFVKRNGEFTVNIALISAHRSILGVVYIPVSQCCYYAAEGTGAYKCEHGQIAHNIHVKKTIGDRFVIAGSRSHGTEQQTKFIDTLGDNTELIAKGSSLKFCLVAEGQVDIYPRFGPTSEWDTAAAHCIVEEAGGTVTDMAFVPLEYNTKESLINPSFLAIADKDFNWDQHINN